MQQMIGHCERDYPNEACGYLVGRNGVAQRAIPLVNVHASPTSYEMDPKEQLAVQRKIREEGWEHLAIYHSHVATEAVPSRRDVAQATAVQDFFDGHYVLVSLQELGRPHVRAFLIRDGNIQEEVVQEVPG